MINHVSKAGCLAGYSNEAMIDPLELLTMPCDVLIPAALEGAIDADLARRIRCRVLAEGANGPTAPAADLVFEERKKDVFLIPDILCNSGGVIVSYFEWVQGLQQVFWDRTKVLQQLRAVLDRSFNLVIARAIRDGISHRAAALSIGIEKVRGAKRTRGLFP